MSSRSRARTTRSTNASLAESDQVDIQDTSATSNLRAGDNGPINTDQISGGNIQEDEENNSEGQISNNLTLSEIEVADNNVRQGEAAHDLRSAVAAHTLADQSDPSTDVTEGVESIPQPVITPSIQSIMEQISSMQQAHEMQISQILSILTNKKSEISSESNQADSSLQGGNGSPNEATGNSPLAQAKQIIFDGSIRETAPKLSSNDPKLFLKFIKDTDSWIERQKIYGFTCVHKYIPNITEDIKLSIANWWFRQYNANIDWRHITDDHVLAYHSYLRTLIMPTDDTARQIFMEAVQRRIRVHFKDRDGHQLTRWHSIIVSFENHLSRIAEEHQATAFLHAPSDAFIKLLVSILVEKILHQSNPHALFFNEVRNALAIHPEYKKSIPRLFTCLYDIADRFDSMSHMDRVFHVPKVIHRSDHQFRSSATHDRTNRRTVESPHNTVQNRVNRGTVEAPTEARTYPAPLAHKPVYTRESGNVSRNSKTISCTECTGPHYAVVYNQELKRIVKNPSCKAQISKARLDDLIQQYAEKRKRYGNNRNSLQQAQMGKSTHAPSPSSATAAPVSIREVKTAPTLAPVSLTNESIYFVPKDWTSETESSQKEPSLIAPTGFTLDSGCQRSIVSASLMQTLEQENAILESKPVEQLDVKEVHSFNPALGSTPVLKAIKCRIVLINQPRMLSWCVDHWFLVVDFADSSSVLIGSNCLSQLGINTSTLSDHFPTDTGDNPSLAKAVLNHHLQSHNLIHSSVKSIKCSECLGGQCIVFPETSHDEDDLDFKVVDLEYSPPHEPSSNGPITPELISAIDGIVQRCVDRGTPQDQVDRLSTILHKHRNVFRIAFHPDDQPLKVPPWKETFIDSPEEDPKGFAPRRYTLEQRQFLDNFTDTMVKCGLMAPWNEAYTSCLPAVLVPKESSKFRVTWDVRFANMKTKTVPYLPPTLEYLRQCIAGSSTFFCSDVFNAFWLIPLHEETQKHLILSTGSSQFIARRVLQGSKNASSAMCIAMNTIFHDMFAANEFQSYIDDCLGFASNPDELLDRFEKFLTRSEEFNLKLSPGKTDVLITSTKFCGSIIHAHGKISVDPSKADDFLQLSRPSTVGSLITFIGILGWMRPHIPFLSELQHPLVNLRTRLSAHTARRTKAQLDKILITSSDWTPECENAFNACREAVRNSIMLTVPEPDDVLAIYTDASSSYYSAILVAINPSELDKPHLQRHIKSVAFLSGAFDERQLKWSIPSKEAYSLVAAARKFQVYFSFYRPCLVYTDHLNLLNCFRPTCHAFQSQVVAGRIYRWALFLSDFNLEIHHISGTTNIIADYASRNRVTESTSSPVLAVRYETPETETDNIQQTTNATNPPDMQISDAYVNAMNHPGFVFPTLQHIVDAQQQILTSNDAALHQQEQLTFVQNAPIIGTQALTLSDSVYHYQNRVWIPCSAKSLITRIMVVGHAGINCHQGRDATINAISSRFFWIHMTRDIRDLVSKCLNCLPSRCGNSPVPRPLQRTLIATRFNQVVSFDFFNYLQARRGSSTTSSSSTSSSSSSCSVPYILVLKDKFTHYCQLYPCQKANSENVVNAFLSWVSNFGIPIHICTDGAKHFASLIVDDLTRILQVDHVFSLPYMSQTNGSVESVGRLMRAAFISLLSANQMNYQQYHLLIPIVNSMLNQKPSRFLGNHSPHEVVFGSQPTRPLDIVQIDPVTIRQISTPPDWDTHITELQEHLQTMSDDIAQLQDTLENNELNARNRRENRKPFIAQVGEYVLLLRLHSRRHHKLIARFAGPYEIVAIPTEHTVQVRDLITEAIRTVHVSLVRKYCDSLLDITQEIREQLLHDLFGFELKALGNYKCVNNQWFIQLTWKGFDENEPISDDQDYETATFVKTIYPQAFNKWLNLLRTSNDSSDRHAYEAISRL